MVQNTMPKKTISQTLRDAVRDWPHSSARLASLSGVDKGVISRFINEQRCPTTRTMDRLAVALGLELRPVRPARKRRKAKKGG